jgi:WD40 repeat protein
VNAQRPVSLSLYDLLARRWPRPAPVVSLAFNSDDSVAAFFGSDGAIAMAVAPDPEPPETRIHIAGDDARKTIRAREKNVPPLLATVAPGARPIALARNGQKGFFVGDEDGAVHRLNANGEWIRSPQKLGAATRAIDFAPGPGLLAFSDGEAIALSRGAAGVERVAVEGGEIAALSFSHGGERLAAAHGRRLSIFDVASRARASEIELAGEACAIVWDKNDRWLACPFRGDGLGLVDSVEGRVAALRNFPTPVRSAGWSAPANALVASGGFRIATWSMAAPPVGDDASGALATGRAGLVVVECVAPHPTRDLVAAGYANGQIVVAAIGGRDEMLLRHSGGAVRALAWSANGKELAVGAEDEAAIVSFPSILFKQAVNPRSTP